MSQSINQFQVALKASGAVPVCGGAIIDSQHVLTSAYCCLRDPNLNVVVGDHDFTIIEANEQRFPIREMVIHEDFNPDDITLNDICLIEIEGEMEYSRYPPRSTYLTA